MTKFNHAELVFKKEKITNTFFNAYKYYSFFVFLIIIILSVYFLKNPLIYYILFYGLIKYLDFNFEPLGNWDESTMKLVRKDDWKFYFPACLGLIANEINFFYCMYLLGSDEHSALFKFIYCCTAAETNALSFNIAHELEHKYGKNKIFGNLIAWLSLSKNYYSYFFLDHDLNHHFNYGTPIDSKYVERGEHFYPYTITAVAREYVWPWKNSFSQPHQLQKLKLYLLSLIPVNLKNYKFIYGLFSKFIFNEMIWLHLVYMALFIFYYYWRGIYGVLFSFMVLFYICIYSAFQDYFSHYGLKKKEVSPGVWEAEPDKHYSWNGSFSWESVVLFNGERHLDHHLNYAKPYQLLNINKVNFLPLISGTDLRGALFNPIIYMEVMEKVFKYEEAQEYDFDDQLLFPAITFWTIYGELIMSSIVYVTYQFLFDI